MFATLILFVISLISEGLMLYFASPEKPSGAINHLAIILFSLNTGVLLGTLFTLILFLVFFAMKAYEEIQNKSFIRRGAIFGLFITLLLIGKFYGVLDKYLIGFLAITMVAFEVIMSREM